MKLNLSYYIFHTKIMRRFDIISVVICIILYVTPVCFSNALTYCMEKKELNDNGFCEITANASSLTAVVQKEAKGVLKLVLVTSMSNCAFDHITVELEIAIATKEKGCIVPDSKLTLKTHSHSKYEFKTEKSCTKSNFTIEMERIFTGCYIMTFSLQQENGSSTITVEPLVFKKWISNNLTAENFHVQKPKDSCERTQDVAEINVYFDTAILHKAMDCSLQKYDSEAGSNSIAKDMSTRNYSFPIDVNANCTVKAGKMTCVFVELPSGTYKLYFDLVGVPWCAYHPDGVFGNECSWNVDFKIVHMDSNNETILELLHGDNIWPESEWVHSALIGLLCLVILVLFVLVYVSRQKQFSRKKMMVTQWKSALANVAQNNDITAEVECEDNVSTILLLYARDCRPFMQAMEQYRELLQTETGLEVYDIFDYRRFNEISRSPNEWIQGRLQERCTKTVLVGSRCGDLIYQNFMQRFAQGSRVQDDRISVRTLYKTPEFLDNVVLHAIKMVSFDVYYQRPYQKYFVSYISNFSSDNTLSQINPFKRYALPGAAMRLVADLRRAPASPPSPHTPLAYPALQQLRDSLDRLSDYVASHPHYLHTDLLKEVE